MPIVLKSWSLDLLEPSGPVQACVWIALPFTHRIEPATFRLVSQCLNRLRHRLLCVFMCVCVCVCGDRVRVDKYNINTVIHICET